MNLKEQMVNDYQKKDSKKIKEAIAESMQKGYNEVFYGKDVITDDIRKEFQDGGFTVEDYEDKHSIDAKIELVRFSW
jgi:methionine aminopeptidase